MLSKTMAKAISQQITKEFYSGYLYLSMASFFESETLPGFAHWMRIQAQEESCHALIFFNYLSEQGHQAELGAIEAPPREFSSPLDVFKKTLEHEKQVTKSIYGLMEIAVGEKDFATQRFLDWFINEQVEEEATAHTLVGKLERIKNSSEGLFMLDNELQTRVFTVPAPLANKI
ncbi:MAG: Ferritin-like protein 2 [Candidatus Ozemobacter sibiricus]|uniref:Ferritin n=1 Tax=Candidatus Ozemobacter sibiricus TaxID=2268124 RepID=A0A367ZB58_9BACT|nr:MAG: Ferritin-like protein 2 [Candidatus Ozemobacter sibiricus]